MENSSTSPIVALLAQIDARKAEIDVLRPLTPEQEGRIMQKFRLDWSYHSNAIEGNSLTYGETIAFLMEGLTAKGKPFKDHQDIKGHNEGIDFLMYFIKNREQLTEKAIRELHELLLVEPYANPAQTPDGQKVEKKVALGSYKTMPNHVKTPTGEIHFYATPEETPAKMTDLVGWLHDHQEKNDLHPLVLASTFHHRFVQIHPFDDGNGRMTRLLMNLILMQYGYPPVVIKQQDRQAYYYALRQADGGDLGAFIEYIGDNLMHSLSIQLKGVRGESLEEEDDLDKEIALLKGSLGEGEAVPKSAEILYKLLAETVFPLFQAIQKQCWKLDEFFFKKSEMAQYGQQGTGSKQTLNTQNWEEVNMNWFQAGWSEALGDNPFKIEYEYHWDEFRNAKEPFNVHCFVSVEFYKFKYEIEFKGQYIQYQISKSYTLTLTKEEFTDLSKIFVKEALAKIKNQRQN